MTRRLFSLLLVLLLLAPVAARQRVAVVLSGGGAKGMGHIGALKVIEQAGLPVDIVVGTSMGALIGGLYSIGYSPGQLDSMVRCQDWKTLLSDKVDRQAQAIDDRARSSRYIVSVPLKRNLRESSLGGMISGQNLAELFATLTVGYQDSLSFDSLPTRFACVAADITTGREHVFRSGQLFTAMRASMAIPGVFTPVRLDGMVLVDGGLCNNYPVDVARRMGADIVIGVTVQSDTAKAAETLTTLPEILNQAVGIATRTKYEENVAATDVLIRIPTAGFGTASFNLAAIDTLISRGEVAAGAQLDSLFALKARLGMALDSVAPPRPPFASLTPTSRIRVARISFTDIKEGDARMVCRKCKLREGEEASLAQIELAQSLLRTASIYSNVTYQIRQTAEGNELHFQAEERYEQTANLGVRFDSDEIATMLVNGAWHFDTRIPSLLDVTLRLGKRYGAYVGFETSPTPLRHVGLNYSFLHNDVDVDRNGRRVYNTVFAHHRFEFELSDAWFRNIRYAVGAHLDYYHVSEFLSGTSEPLDVERDPLFINYFARFSYDSFDRAYYPMRGSRASLGFTLHTDNFFGYEGGTPFAAADGSLTVCIPLNSRLVLEPTLAARALIGPSAPFIYNNVYGSALNGRYLDQQIAFNGLSTVEQADRYFGTFGLKLRQRIGGHHYVTGAASYGVSADELNALLRRRQLVGVSLTYGYDSFFGPLEATLNYFNPGHSVSLYINLGLPF